VSLTHQPGLVAAVTFAAQCPWLTFGLLAGVLADRWNHRRTLWTIEACRTVVLGGLVLALLLHDSRLWMVYLVAFLLGSGTVLFNNTAQSMLPTIVRSDQLERANARIYAVETAGREFAGPPLGGVLLSVSRALPFAVDAASSIIGAALLAAPGVSSPPRPHDEATRPRIMAEIGTGVRWLWRHRVLRAYALILGATNFLTGAVFALTVVFAVRDLRLSDAGYGLLLAAGALGSVVGSMTAGRITSRVPSGVVLFNSILLPGVAFIVLSMTSSAVVAASMLAVDGFTAVLWAVITVSLRQQIVPSKLLGRVNSAYRFVGWGTGPIGALAGGGLAQLVGVRTPILLAGLGFVLVALGSSSFLRTRVLEDARASTLDAV
jgi:MFS family permease